MRNAHIVIATVGSLGDLFPFLALGQALRAAGHRVTLATHGIHQLAIEQAGLMFADASGMAEPEDREAFTARAFDRWHGPRFVVHDFAAMDVQVSYRKLLPVVSAADVLITTTLAFAGQILGEQLSGEGSLHWLSAVLAPAGFLSAFDPPATGMAMLDRVIAGSPRRGRWLQRMARWVTRGWTAPVRDFRRSLKLAATSVLGDPFHQGQHAPAGVLALFPSLLGQRQPDWPTAVHVTGFARYAQTATLDPALADFLEAGAPPVVFTLGSTAVHMGTDFLRVSLAAAVALNLRAVLLTGSPAMRANLPDRLPSTIHAVDYAPHAALFPRAALVVHHGGVGTSSEALYAGKPMLVVPYGFDQPDNAARLHRLGVAEILPAARYRLDRAAVLLQKLLGEAVYREKSAACAKALREDTAAADVVAIITSLSLPATRLRGRKQATRRTEN